MRHGDLAWVALAALILAYEALAPENELLSEAMDRYRQRHPVITTFGIALVAAHLARWLPARVDPVHQLAVRIAR